MKLKSLPILCVVAAIFISCESTPTSSTLDYTWAEADSAAYNYLKKNDEESLNNLLEQYQICVAASDKNGNPTFIDYEDKQIEIRGGTPPGICADYGYLLIKTGNTEEGRIWLEKEMELYPESTKFVSKLLEALE